MMIVSLIGLKKSGKTATAENLIREFGRRGLRVGSVKFMPNSRLTIDVKGKDTWRHRQAGADFVISLSKGEIAFIGKLEGRADIGNAIDLVPEGTDVLICEGYNSPDPGIIKILCARDEGQVEETIRIRGIREGFLAVSGIISSTGFQHPEYRVLDSTDPVQLSIMADLILGQNDEK